MKNNLAPNGRSLIDTAVVIFGDVEGFTDEMRDKQIQQVGVDLTVADISKIVQSNLPPAFVSFSSKQACALRRVPLMRDNLGEYYLLEKGQYDVTFNEGLAIPDDLYLRIRQRSTLLRSGHSLHSSIFDPGFKTQRIGSVLHINGDYKIYRNARIGQIYATRCEPVAKEDLYGSEAKGSSYQHDSQRKRSQH